MYRYKLCVEYVGTAFDAGWQSQPNKTSVQEALEDAVYKTVQERVRVHGASRTDKNVHALQQVAHIDLSRQCSTQRIFNGMNFHLRIFKCRVCSVEQVDTDFHARFSVKSKLYRYCVCHHRVCSVFDIDLCWFIHSAVYIDLDLMMKNAQYLCGQHDFSSFRDSVCQSDNSVRSIDSVNIYKSGSKIYFDFCARSFLHKQIRIMVGTLIDIGRGHLKHGIQQIIGFRDRSYAGQTAPGYGLYLISLSYSGICSS